MPFRKVYSFKKAFTLVELLIVVTIMGILTVGGIVNYRSSMQKQDFKNGMSFIVNLVRSIQNRALSGTLSDVTVNGVKAKYWGIRFQDPNAQGYIVNTRYYSIFISNNNDSCGDNTNSIEQSSGKLASNTWTNMANTCIFSSMEDGSLSMKRTFSNNVTNSYSALHLSNDSSGGNNKYLYINSAGLVYVQKP